MAIEPGQVYRSCKPRDMGFRIRIVEVGAETSRGVDASNGRPLLWRVMNRDLHDSATTRTGKPRRAGYVRETEKRGERA